MRSKAIGCALSAALAAAAPAAALADTGTGSSTADTPVYLDVERAVLRVAVPMDLRLVAPAAGGALACPSDGVYGVWNYSTNTAVFINKVEAVYNERANAHGARWRLVDDASLVGPYRETDGAELANLMVVMEAPHAEGGADAFTLDAEHPTMPAADSAWRIGKAQPAAAGAAVEGVMFPLNFQADACASSIVRDAPQALRMSQGDAALGIDPAAAFRLRFPITTVRP